MGQYKLMQLIEPRLGRNRIASWNFGNVKMTCRADSSLYFPGNPIDLCNVIDVVRIQIMTQKSRKIVKSYLFKAAFPKMGILAQGCDPC